MFYHKHNPRYKSLAEVKDIVLNEDKNATVLAEVTGFHVPAHHLVAGILHRLGNENLNMNVVDDVVNSIQLLFLKHPCSLYDKDTYSTLAMLRHESSLSILSNTGFILGQTLNKALDFLNISHFFLFKIYSDEVFLAKPYKGIFLPVVSSAAKYKKCIEPWEIAHVGDNPIADGGCISAKINYVQINSNDKTIKDLLR